MRNTILRGRPLRMATLGILLSVMESAAARPGVLVMPPVMVPKRSRILIFKHHPAHNHGYQHGKLVAMAAYRTASQPLFLEGGNPEVLSCCDVPPAAEQQQSQLSQQLVGRALTSTR